MDRKHLVSAICDQADGLLAGITKPVEARAGISEWLTIHHPELPPDERKEIVAETVAILEEEGFFEAEAGNGD